MKIKIKIKLNNSCRGCHNSDYWSCIYLHCPGCYQKCKKEEFCFVFFYCGKKTSHLDTTGIWHCSQCHNLHIILLSCTYLLTEGPLPIAHQQTSVQNCGNTGLIGQSVTDCYRFMVLNPWSKVFTLLYNITRLSLQTHFKLGLAITLPFQLVPDLVLCPEC